MSCLLEKELPFAWTLINAQDPYVEFPLNQIAYALIEHNEEHSNKSVSEEESDLRRVEHKVDLILQMLGHIMQASSGVPDKIRLQLSADEIAWYYPEAVIDQDYQVTLFLSEDYRLPLNLLVRVIKIESGWCHAVIKYQRADEQTTWEKWVFRQHRRHVAHIRADTNP